MGGSFLKFLSSPALRGVILAAHPLACPPLIERGGLFVWACVRARVGTVAFLIKFTSPLTNYPSLRSNCYIVLWIPSLSLPGVSL